MSLNLFVDNVINNWFMYQWWNRLSWCDVMRWEHEEYLRLQLKSKRGAVFGSGVPSPATPKLFHPVSCLIAFLTSSASPRSPWIIYDAQAQWLHLPCSIPDMVWTLVSQLTLLHSRPTSITDYCQPDPVFNTNCQPSMHTPCSTWHTHDNVN